MPNSCSVPSKCTSGSLAEGDSPPFFPCKQPYSWYHAGARLIPRWDRREPNRDELQPSPATVPAIPTEGLSPRAVAERLGADSARIAGASDRLLSKLAKVPTRLARRAQLARPTPPTRLIARRRSSATRSSGSRSSSRGSPSRSDDGPPEPPQVARLLRGRSRRARKAAA